MPRSITINQQSRSDFELPFDIDDDVSRIEIHNFAGASLDWLPGTVERLRILGPGPLCDQHTRNLKNLNFLELLCCNLEPDGVFPFIPNLKKLKLFQTNVSNIHSLEEGCSLELLWITDGGLRDIGSLCSHPKLRVVALRELENLVDVSSLGSCTLIEDLDISETSVRNIEFVNTLPNLEQFSAESTAIDTIAPLAGCKSLESINVNDTGVEDLAPLKGLKYLGFLKFDGREFSGRKAVSDFLKNRHPNPLISSYRSMKGKLAAVGPVTKNAVVWSDDHPTIARFILGGVAAMIAWVLGFFEKLAAMLG